MSGFTSSYQGLARPSKAGLVLAGMIAGGMAYASPEGANLVNLDLSQLASTVDFTFTGARSWDADLQPFLSPLQETYQASLTKIQEGAAALAAATTTTTTTQGPLVEHLQAVPGQFQEWTTNLWMQVQAQTDQLASVIQNALPSSTAGDFFGPALENQMSGMTAAMGSMTTQMQDAAANKAAEVVQDTQHDLVPQLSAMASHMQDTVASKSAELKDTVVPQMSESVNAMTANIQDTIAKQASQVQVSMPQMTEYIGSVASKMQDTVASKASQVRITMPDMSHVQATVSSKLAEVSNVQDAVVAKVTQVQPPEVVVQEIVSAKASVVKVASVRESLASVDGVVAQAQFDRLTQSLLGQ